MVLFKLLNTGAQFIHNNMTWIKVTPVKSGSCGCKIKYNAHVVGDKDTYKVFSPNQEVQAV